MITEIKGYVKVSRKAFYKGHGTYSSARDYVRRNRFCSLAVVLC